MWEFWLVLFRLCNTCKTTTVGFPLLYNSSPKYKFLLFYSKRIQKTLRKPTPPNRLIFIYMKENQIS